MKKRFIMFFLTSLFFIFPIVLSSCSGKCDHDYFTLVKPATCLEEGYTTYICRNCEHSYKGDYVTGEHKYLEEVLIAATCTSKGESRFICQYCNKTYVSKTDALGHDIEFSPAINPTCTQSGLSEGRICKRCDKVLLKQEVISSLKHNYILTETTEATCTEEGKLEYTCSNCNHSYIEKTNELGHNVVIDSKVDPTCEKDGLTEGSHCSRCNEVIIKQEKIPALSHNYIETITKAPTCTEDGVKTYKCDDCNKSYTETLLALGHNVVIDEAKEATCIESGLTEGSHCDRCNEVLVEQYVINNGGHDYITVNTATCTEPGIITHTCNNCGDTYTEESPALGHNEIIDQAINPTCTQTGLTEGKHCNRCNEVLIEQQIILALGHNYESLVTKEPTCLDLGELTYTCKNCNESYKEDISALGHNVIVDELIEATCTTTGLTEGSHCDRCNIILVEQNIISALGHDSVIDQAINPTCTTTGLTEGSHCSRCSEVLIEQEIRPALDHAYTSQIITEPTCLTKGEKKFTCQSCSDSYNEEIEALGHSSVTDMSVSATCTTTGLTEGSHCSRCNEILVAQEIIPMLDHTYIQSIYKEPTCLEKGINEFKCMYCSDSYQTDINPLGHNAVVDEAIEATCTTTGLSEGSHCSRCNTVLIKQEETPIIDHNYISSITKQPTCEAVGEISYICKKCTHTYTEELPTIEHNIVIDKAIEATCTTTGLTEGSHCTSCGIVIIYQTEIPVLEHNYTCAVEKEPSCNGTGIKSYTCELCSDYYTEMIEKLGHNVIVDAAIDPTCTNFGLTEGSHCDRCNKIIVEQYEIPMLEHEYESSIIKEATCTGTGIIEFTCKKCNNSYTEMLDKLGHDAIIDEAIEATCTQTGLTEGSHCSRCNKVLVEQNIIDVIEHSYYLYSTENPSCTVSGYNIYMCSICNHTYEEEIEMLGHSIVIDEAINPTCLDIGLTEGSHCDRCQLVLIEQEVVAALGHNVVIDEMVNPTCITTGLTEGSHCDRCNMIFIEQTKINFIDHNPVMDEAVAATCLETGLTEGSHCSMCNLVLIRQGTIPALGHDSVVDVAIEATCTTTGLTEGSHCSRCNTILISQAETQALGHSELIDFAISPTCTTTGLTQGSHCSRCQIKIIEQEVIAALGHNEVIDAKVAPTCTQTGLTEGSHCDRCNEVLTQQIIIEALGHTEATISAVAATCTTNGLTAGKYCTICNEITLEQQVIEAPGHINDSVVTKEATCTENGLETLTCIVCGYSCESIIEALGHTEVLIPGTPATCTTEGISDGYYCSVCGVTTVEQVELAALGHNLVETKKLEPTCVEFGEIEITCTHCDYVAYTYPDPLGHTQEIIPSVASTCSTPGLSEGIKCSKCSVIIVAQTELPLASHTYTSKITTEATCESEGKLKYSCLYCSNFYSEIIPALGHNIIIDLAVNPTCQATGLTEGSHCSVCEKILVEQEIVPLVEHSYVYSITTPATCLVEGFATNTCKWCNDQYEEKIAALGHNEVVVEAIAATCTTAGKTEGSKCSRCDLEFIKQETIEALGHTFNAVETVAATCTTNGYDKYTCKNCTHYYTNNEIEAFGHTLEYGICDTCDHIDPDSFNSRYGYEYLATREKGESLQALYNDINDLCLSFHENYNKVLYVNGLGNLNFSKYNLLSTEAAYVWQIYRMDNPLFYWYRYGYSTGTNYGSSIYNFLQIRVYEEFFSPKVRKSYDEKFVQFIREYVTPEIMEETTYNKALYFHDVIVGLIDYKYNDAGNPDPSGYAHSIAGILDRTGVVCEGYAFMFDLLLEITNEEAVYSRGDNHAYNLVKMEDGNWYWFDLTWDDDANWELGHKYNYFCVNDTQDISSRGYLWSSSSRNFMVGHQPYQYETMNGSASYELPERSSVVYDSDQLILNDQFTVGDFTYVLIGYNKVMLCKSTATGDVVVDSTVTYKGRTYDVVAIGGFVDGEHYPSQVFAYNTTSVYIPESIEFIIDRALNCNTIKEYNVSTNNDHFVSVDGVLYTKNMFTLIKYPSAKNVSSYTIDDATVDIAMYAFRNCSYLRYLYLGANTTNIGTYHYGYGYRTSTSQTLRYDSSEYDELTGSFEVISYEDINSDALYIANYNDNNQYILAV